LYCYVEWWIDGKGKPLSIFLVSCCRGIMFIKFVDVSAHVNDATLCVTCWMSSSEGVGVEHVYAVVDKMLMARQLAFFCTVCVTYCLDLVLEDIKKVYFVWR